MLNKVLLKNVEQSDLEIFFHYQQDKEAQYIAAFIQKKPDDREAFDSHWHKITHDNNTIIKTIYFADEVVGHIARYLNFRGHSEITFWIGKEFWGKGIATTAVQSFLKDNPGRPIYARVAIDNIGSIRVLEKSGFSIEGYENGFANARNKNIDEVVMKLS
ncbi:MAG: GNAT family N-acetyltransferase [Candidatus Hodarchaeales archaeon]|jgi:RimJ/RimL family protein N-acetyltransferase